MICLLSFVAHVDIINEIIKNSLQFGVLDLELALTLAGKNKHTFLQIRQEGRSPYV